MTEFHEASEDEKLQVIAALAQNVSDLVQPLLDRHGAAFVARHYEAIAFDAHMTAKTAGMIDALGSAEAAPLARECEAAFHARWNDVARRDPQERPIPRPPPR